MIVAVIDRLPVDPAMRDEAERVLLDQAASLNASELRKAGDHLLEMLDPDGTARAEEAALDRLERSAHLGRFLTIADDGLGGVRVRGRGTVEDAAVIKTALHALAARCRAPTRTAAKPAGTPATTAPAPGTPSSRPVIEDPGSRGAAARTSTAPSPGSPSPSPSTSSATGSAPRPWTPATTSRSPQSADWRAMPR